MRGKLLSAPEPAREGEELTPYDAPRRMSAIVRFNDSDPLKDSLRNRNAIDVAMRRHRMSVCSSWRYCINYLGPDPNDTGFKPSCRNLALSAESSVVRSAPHRDTSPANSLSTRVAAASACVVGATSASSSRFMTVLRSAV